MRINVLLFAGIAEAVGDREIQLELPDGLNVKEAWRIFEENHPSAAKASAGAAFVVNESYVRPADYILREGDTLAAIPPVSGG